GCRQRSQPRFQLAPHGRELPPQIEMPQPRRRHFQALPPPLGGRFRRPPQPEAQLIHLLLAPPDHLAHALHGAMLRQFAQPPLRAPPLTPPLPPRLKNLIPAAVSVAAASPCTCAG